MFLPLQLPLQLIDIIHNYKHKILWNKVMRSIIFIPTENLLKNETFLEFTEWRSIIDRITYIDEISVIIDTSSDNIIEFYNIKNQYSPRRGPDGLFNLYFDKPVFNVKLNGIPIKDITKEFTKEKPLMVLPYTDITQDISFDHNEEEVPLLYSQAIYFRSILKFQLFDKFNIKYNSFTCFSEYFKNVKLRDYIGNARCIKLIAN